MQCPRSASTRVIKLEVEGLVTVAGRLGWAWNNALLYGKGGVAFVRNHVQYTDNGAGNAHEWKGGWMVGGGAEYGITPSISAKLEYNYMDFGTKRYGILDCNSLCRTTGRPQAAHPRREGWLELALVDTGPAGHALLSRSDGKPLERHLLLA